MIDYGESVTHDVTSSIDRYGVKRGFLCLRRTIMENKVNNIKYPLPSRAMDIEI